MHRQLTRNFLHVTLQQAMSRRFLTLALILILGFLVHTPASAQDQPGNTIEITSPLAGEAVQGLAQIAGTVDVEGFQSYSLAFAFHSGAEKNWFPIMQSATPVFNGVIGEWDTSLLVDDMYDLQMTVNIVGEDPIILMIEGLRIRNYTAIETATPRSTQSDQQTTPTVETERSPTTTPTPNTTPTQLPGNKAAVTSSNLRKALQNGMAIGLIFILFLTLYQSRRGRNN